MKTMRMKACCAAIALLALASDVLRVQGADMPEIHAIPYPSEEHSSKVSDNLDPAWLHAAPLLADDINATFSNLEDLRWLEPIAKERQVVLVGENHYYQRIAHLRNRILFALNTFDSFPLIVLECPYSLTPWLNHYLDIPDDGKAEEYLRTVCQPLLKTADIVDLLRHVRRWNMTGRKPRMQFGLTDLEFDYQTTLDLTIRPFMTRLNPDLARRLTKITLKELKDLLPELRSTVDGATARNMQTEYPFITAVYLQSVVDNLEATCKAMLGEPVDRCFDSEKKRL
ncbi:MAG: hypothetical protein WCS01_16810, partial [bacterium]